MEKAQELNKDTEEEEEEKWTACLIERAIWAAAATDGKAN